MKTIFETDRLYITTIESENDIIALYENIYNNNENLSFLNFKEKFTLNNLRLKLLLYRKYYKVDLGIYIAKNKINNEIIAEASFFNTFDNILTPEIGYIINKPYWNKGYGTELVRGMIDYLFLKKIEVIYARINANNIHSSAVCLNNGFSELSKELLDNGIIRQTLIIKRT